MAEAEEGGVDTAYVAQLLEEVMLGGLTLREIQSITPTQMEAMYALAYQHYTQGQDKKAEKLFSYLVRLDHLDARYWLGLAGARQRLGKHPQALKAYAACGLLDPENPMPGLFAAESFMALGDLENAESGLAAALFWAGDKPEHAPIRARAEVLMQALERRRGGKAAAGKGNVRAG